MINVHICMYTYIVPQQQKSDRDISKQDSHSGYGVSVQRPESIYILGPPHFACTIMSRFRHTYARYMNISKINNSNTGISTTDIQ